MGFRTARVFLETMHGIDTGLDLSQIASTCEMVERRTLPVHPWKAISGRQAWQVDLPYGYIPLLERGTDSFPPPWACVNSRWLGYDVFIPWIRQFATAPLLRLKLQSMQLPAHDEAVERAKTAVESALDSMNTYPIWIPENSVDDLLSTRCG